MVGEAHSPAFDHLGIRIAGFTDKTGLVRIITAAQGTKVVVNLFLSTIVKSKFHFHFFRG